MQDTRTEAGGKRGKDRENEGGGGDTHKNAKPMWGEEIRKAQAM